MQGIDRLMGGLRIDSLRGHELKHNSAKREREDFEGLKTSSISLVSHHHGRLRREERSITRRELQEAIKHGQREPAHQGMACCCCCCWTVCTTLTLFVCMCTTHWLLVCTTH